MAFTSIAALVGGTATVNAALVLSAMVEVGTAMSVVGAVTGNKSLLKLGAVVGLVGGVGGMVSGAAGAAGAASAVGVQTEAQIAAQGALDVGSQSITSAVGGGALSGVDLPSMDLGAPAGATGAAPPGAASPVPSAGSGVSNAGATASSPPVQATGPTALGAPETRTPVGAGGPADVGEKFATDSAGKGDSFFGKVGSYLKDPANKEIVNSGVKLLGGALQGANESDMFDQKIGFAKEQFADEQARRANVTNGQNQSRSGIIQKVQA